MTRLTGRFNDNSLSSVSSDDFDFGNIVVVCSSSFQIKTNIEVAKAIEQQTTMAKMVIKYFFSNDFTAWRFFFRFFAVSFLSRFSLW